ncbi:hypothetical protein A3709_05270 [Halioglobus sp. HI00S01]|uniref:hypothetical protein n=1 Tax=Halioglobus sp. HI00S01 TaxID=1822214 RepID=UPI0007C2AE2F|nr:hypothetical protein [Halioglobus sp. HI00S01]KZX56513.1 hypothetical protein A3709_05270 [Halioglobus sp. HI00S01]
MTEEHLRVIIVVYTSALLPLVIVPLLHWRKKIPSWSLRVYIVSFLFCALGWELWFTFGLLDGDPVNVRRATTLNEWIPEHINWAMNSLADAGSIALVALWLAWSLTGKNSDIFRHWHWPAFAIMMAYCLGQNIIVEMYLYHDQLAIGKRLSWAPLAPTGPWYNPTLFEFRGRTITLQGQVPWLLMTPILYWLTILLANSQQKMPQNPESGNSDETLKPSLARETV